MIELYTKDGKLINVYPVDARELLQQGHHFEYNPKKKKPVSLKGPMSKYTKDQDIMGFTKDQLIEYALEIFSMKLNRSFGEIRMRDEIYKARKSDTEKEEELESIEATRILEASEIDDEDNEDEDEDEDDI